MKYTHLAGIVALVLVAAGCRIESQLGPRRAPPPRGPPPEDSRDRERVSSEPRERERGAPARDEGRRAPADRGNAQRGNAPDRRAGERADAPAPDTRTAESKSSTDLTDEVARRCSGGTTELKKNLSSEQTLRSNCYKVKGTIDVKAKVTIEPGATFVFGDGGGLQVKKKGRLRAEGTRDNPIIFSAEEPIPGYWKGVRYGPSNSTHNVLRHVVIEYGGEDDWGYKDGGPGNLTIDSARLEMSDVRLQHGKAAGLYVRNFEALTMSGGSVFSGNKVAANVSANTLGRLSPESSYTGNDEDFIKLRGGDVTEDATWSNFNAPIRVHTNMEVKNAHLEIAGGNELVFRQDKGLKVKGSASMAIAGTEQAPVTFRGEEPIAGYWQGIRYGNTNSAKNRIEHVVIRDGGSDDWGYKDGGPANLTLDGTRIETAHSITLQNSDGPGIFTRGDATFTPECRSLDNRDGFNTDSPPC